jgi:Pyruvate/2-oxoacid:ferredoxin oxidoreductase delta subunit
MQIGNLSDCRLSHCTIYCPQRAINRAISDQHSSMANREIVYREIGNA